VTRRANWLLGLLLAACIARLWLMELPSSFWLDEMVTVFIARHGMSHWSLVETSREVHQLAYYPVAQAAGRLLGQSEIAYRVPSVLFMALALFAVARLAARLVAPNAAWFAAFACLLLGGFNYEAADARAYPMGICAIAVAFWFLVRWLDSARWGDALAFVAAGALVWRVHWLDCPVYAVFLLYAAIRVARRETPVSTRRAVAVFCLLALTLAPAVPAALRLMRQAPARVFAPPPSLRALGGSFKLLLVIGLGGGAWILSRLPGWQAERKRIELSAIALISGWWLLQPIALFAANHVIGASLFAPRYLSFALPGAALAATLAAGRFIPPARWKPLAAVLGCGALLWFGQWRELWPRHHNSDWRAAARAVNQLAGPDTPVLCPSPFFDAVPPVWRADYPLPGMLYSHLDVYRIGGRPYLLPFANTTPAGLAAEVARSGRFMVYGWEPQVHFWRDWLPARPELAGWRMRRIGPFADVDVVIFERQ
jgi:hypothetical protein